MDHFKKDLFSYKMSKMSISKKYSSKPKKVLIPENPINLIKDFRILLKRIDDCSQIRDSTPYTGDLIRVVGEPNPSPDWRKKLEDKVEANKEMIRSADISNHKLITRRNKCWIEVLMPERTRGIHQRYRSKQNTLPITEQVERQMMFADK